MATFKQFKNMVSKTKTLQNYELKKLIQTNVVSLLAIYLHYTFAVHIYKGAFIDCNL